MKNEKLEESIRKVVESHEQTREEIEKEIITYLDEKYLRSKEKQLEDKIVQRAKETIINTIYHHGCELGEGWMRYSVIPSYRSLFIHLFGPAEIMFVDRIFDELLADELIYTKTQPGDDEPKTIGLTQKGILYKVGKDLMD